MSPKSQSFRPRPIPDRIYLDHAATTPLRPQAQAAMAEGFRLWANPSSPHGEGRRARALLEDARDRIKAALGWRGELIFTSGASEGAALALGRAVGGRRIISAVEHDCVLQAAPDAMMLRAQRDGLIDPDALAKAVAGQERPVVAVQSVNSETGAGQVLDAICAQVRAAGGIAIVDASQSAGKAMGPLHGDMIIVSAHKFGGPVGIGALLLAEWALIAPSGGHERGYRRGTENLPGALGMAAALEAAQTPYLKGGVTEALGVLADRVRDAGGVWHADHLAHPCDLIHAVAMPGIPAAAQVMRFDMAGIAVSQGSACSSGTMKASRVLEAMGVATDIAERTIRVSAGWTTTPAEIRQFTEIWSQISQAKS